MKSHEKVGKILKRNKINSGNQKCIVRNYEYLFLQCYDVPFYKKYLNYVFRFMSNLKWLKENCTTVVNITS